MEVVGLEDWFASRAGFTPLLPEVSYEREPPRLVNPETTTEHIRQRYATATRSTIPQFGVAVFEDAISFHKGILAVTPRHVLEESLEHAERGIPEEWRRPLTPVQRFGEAISVIKRGVDNYGHFLVEMAPRLMLAAETLPSHAPILLHAKSKPFAGDILETCGVDPDRVVWVDDQPVSVERLHWPVRNAVLRLHNSPAIFPLLRSLGQKLRRTDDRPRAERLFVGRRDARTRQLGNDAEVAAALEPLGFQAVSPGNLTFEEQVRTFAGARVVVAVGGAALTNMVFMPPGGVIVMIGPPGMAGYFFWDLAHHGEHDLSILWGEAEPDSATGKNAAFRVDEAELLDVVRGALDRAGRFSRGSERVP